MTAQKPQSFGPETLQADRSLGMASFLSSHLSKKTSESGAWTPDSESPDCMLCHARFTLTKRRHHCRRCGKLVCGPCSSKKVHLEVSRSGEPKRVCGPCFNSIAAEETPDSPADVRKAVPSTGGGSGAGSDDGPGSSSGPSSPKPSPPVAPGALVLPPVPPSVRKPMVLPDLTASESADQLKAGYSLEGDWTGIFQFYVVDIGPMRKDSAKPVTAGFNPAVKGRRSSILNSSAHVREGSKVRIEFSLAAKGPSYLTGTLPAFGQFGRDGKVTGSIQKMSGKIALQFQIQNFGVTTSFNLTCLLSRKHELCGHFSGCEMSKTSGTVSGVFRAAKADAEGEEDDSEGEPESKDPADAAAGGP